MSTTDALASERRDAAEQRLADYIKAIVDQAPPLNQDARDRLTLLLGGGGRDGA